MRRNVMEVVSESVGDRVQNPNFIKSHTCCQKEQAVPRIAQTVAVTCSNNKSSCHTNCGCAAAGNRKSKTSNRNQTRL